MPENTTQNTDEAIRFGLHEVSVRDVVAIMISPEGETSVAVGMGCRMVSNDELEEIKSAAEKTGMSFVPALEKPSRDEYINKMWRAYINPAFHEFVKNKKTEQGFYLHDPFGGIKYYPTTDDFTRFLSEAETLEKWTDIGTRIQELKDHAQSLNEINRDLDDLLI